MRRFGEGKGWAYKIVLSSDGKSAATVHLMGDINRGTRTSAINLWNALEGTHIRQMAGVPKAIYSLALSRDGRILAAGGGDGAKVWEVDSGSTLVKLLALPR